MNVYGTPWLTPWEQEEVIREIMGFGLIRYDNKRSLPLKSGGTTDVYINLRDARNDPKAPRYLATVYANALRRLKADRFAEIPDSVSCIAPHLAEQLGCGYITLRDAPKEGRVTKAAMIGTVNRGERVVLFDDVITTGGSKVGPFRTLMDLPIQQCPLVVLVDRQQGWKQGFAAANIPLEVWPGMTLHDVRRFLISTGQMQRCDPTVEAQNPIIVALDGRGWEDILPIADRLRPTGCILKVNDLLWERGFERLLPDLGVYARIMADIKAHDIKNTVENIVKWILRHNVWAITVHGSGGGEMIKAAVATLQGTLTKVLVVTVLTTIDPATCEEIYHRRPIEQVLTLAKIGAEAGAHGFVCSAHEVSELKRLYPDKTLVIPGVRSPGAEVGDQKRVDTPANAIASGATNLVMGRQLLNAKDPVAELSRVLREELHLQSA